MISINKLRKEFDQGVVALDSIDLEIRDTEFVALLGPSGCGKSTTLNCIAGLLDVTSGQVMFDDADDGTGDGHLYGHLHRGSSGVDGQTVSRGPENGF